MTQLDLFLADVDPPAGPSRYRRRIARLCGQAFELGKRRAEARCLAEPVAKSLGAGAVVPMTPEAGATIHPVLTQPFKKPAYVAGLSQDERREIATIARGLQRLAPSHRSPESYFIEKDAIIKQTVWKRLSLSGDKSRKLLSAMFGHSGAGCWL
jgi:hypothetical protein